MTLSYNLAYQEIILVQGVRFLLANHTLLSGTSETQSYSALHLETNLSILCYVQILPSQISVFCNIGSWVTECFGLRGHDLVGQVAFADAWVGSLGHPTAVFGFGLGPSPNTKPVHTIDGWMDIRSVNTGP